MKLPIMYHGSDLRIISMSQDERVDYKNKCLYLAQYLWPYFSKCVELGNFYSELKTRISKDLGESYWINLYNALCCHSGLLNNNQFYQYDNNVIYLTNLKSRAENYARGAFAGGETGMLAYRLQEMAAFVGIDLYSLPHNLQSALEAVRKFGNSTPHPVIFEIKNYEIDKLKFENGNSIPECLLSSFNGEFGGSFRYYGNLEFDISSAIKL